MNIGCQTITFGEDQRERFPAVFRSIHESGYTGVEIGYRRLAGYDIGELRELLAKNSLSLFASHIGGNLEDESQAAGERSLLDEILIDLNNLGIDTLMYSGLQYDTAEQFACDLEMIRRSAKTAADHGVKLLYHNHNWEFLNDARIYRALVEDGGDDLGFCPDVGWIFKGGVSILDTLESIRDRIGVIHFKDFATVGTGSIPELLETVEFGDGIVPLGEVADWVTQNVSVAWVVAEQDRTRIAPEEAVAKNGSYLSSIFHMENA
jgi:sugar phosphate isomerase/epimerase